MFACIHKYIIYADAILWGLHQKIGMLSIQIVNCSGYYHSAVAEQNIHISFEFPVAEVG